MKLGILSLFLLCLFPASLWGATETLHLPLVLDPVSLPRRATSTA